MKKWITISGIIIIYYFLFLFFIFITLKIVINFKTNPDLKKIDAIVVLTGGKGRINLGKQFLRANKNIYFIVTGANPNFSLKFLREKLNLHGKNVIIENRSKNTIENAYEVKKIIKKYRIKKILLITSKSHMIRALIIFKMILPNNIKIYPFAVQDKITFFKIFKENIKLIYFFIKFFI